MQKRMKEYLNELKRRQKRRRKAAIAAVLLVVLVVGMVSGGLTGSGFATTEEENAFGDSEVMTFADVDASEEEEIPEEEETPGPGTETPAPEETPDPGTETPASEETPDPGTETPAPEETPGFVTKIPAATKAPAAVSTDTNPPSETTGASADAGSLDDSAIMAASEIDGTGETTGSWSFDAYYVNQPGKYDVTLTSNFNLKYQMEFNTSRSFEAEEVFIKIDAALFKDRKGNSVMPSEIGVPEGRPGEGNYVPHRSIPFNYYEEDGKLIFFNYDKIDGGFKGAWQVLYKDQKLMNIKDGESWEEKTPEVSINGGNTFEEYTSLSGKIDSSVRLTSVTKSYYTETGRKYTPGLYTLNQVQQYISNTTIDNQFLTDGKLNTTDWRYVVWDVKVSGTATQPWDLNIEDIPGTGAEVVGYKDNSSSNRSYNIQINQGGTVLENQSLESFAGRFWVVTAYPSDGPNAIEEGDLVNNEITVTLKPRDGKDPEETRTVSAATWQYKNYHWTYPEGVLSVSKYTEKTSARYAGWLDVYRLYRQLGDNDADYSDMSFTTTGRLRGYCYTHQGLLGEYIPKTYYTLTTVDDFVYLYGEAGTGDGSATAGKMLDEKDYYFSGVTVTQKDYGYDIWEDREVDSQLSKVNAGSLPDTLKNGGEAQSQVRIYAMLAAPNTGNSFTKDGDWYLIDTVSMDDTGKMKDGPCQNGQVEKGSYQFSEDIIAQQPWRVKAEHDTIDYRTECEIKVNVHIKINSPKMGEVIEAREQAADNGASPEVKFENLSGALGTVHHGTKEVSYIDEGSPIKDSDNEWNYDGRDDLKKETKKLYNDNEDENILPIRDNAEYTVTWLNKTADAYKMATSTNDVRNNRMLVDYCLTAYDGYEIYSKSSLNYLRKEDRDLISPGRNHVVFYDLLPYGMKFDASSPITAGRITDLSTDTYQTRPKSWDGNQVTVTVDPTTDVIANYRGTGRTMVAFHVSFSGEDATSYTKEKWIEGWGVSFRAYYDWKDIDQINKININANLCAFMPDFSGLANGSNDSRPELIGLNTQVYYDKGDQSDPAYADMVKKYKDEGPGNIDGLKVQIKDKEGQPVTGKTSDDYRNVLYAKNVLDSGDVATSYQAKIEKLVRADDDRFGTFERTAVVPVGEGKDGLYTYDITVTTDKAITGIVIFDRLERAAADYTEGSKDPFASEFTEGLKTWSGAFQSVDTNGLDKQKIPYTVYYSDQEGAAIDAAKLNETNHWYTEEKFAEKIEENNWQEHVEAVAVSLENYELPAHKSVSFQIRMKAPAELPEGTDNATYNNASFSSVLANVDESSETVVTGSSVKVMIDDKETLEVIKKTEGSVPDAFLDQKFEFRLYEKYEYNGKTETKYLAYTEYRLYKQGKEEPESGVYSTDGDGYFYLHAGEKAVFETASVDRIHVEETADIFWESKPADETDEDKRIRTVTVTNTYRPVLYAQKKVSAVPDGVGTSNEKFTFKIEVKKNGIYVPLKEADFWYVDSVRLDGGQPEKLRSDRTDKNGEFEIKAGEIVALFPGAEGTEYRLSETKASENWICEADTITGTMSVGGVSRTITNFYKWKDLLLTKDITHQTEEDYKANPKPFTFRISEVGKDEEGNETFTRVDGKEWVLLDESGKAVGTPDLLVNGEFTCAMGFQTVRIRGLEAEKTYLVEEVTKEIPAENGKPLYVPVDEGKATTTMPVYSAKKDVTITNDYRKRPLSVKKTVVKLNENTSGLDDGTLFRFTAAVNGKKLSAGTEYTVTTAEGTELTRQVIGGASQSILSIDRNGSGDNQVNPYFVLADGETATFKDVGMIGDTIEVTEIDNDFQIYPAQGESYEYTILEDEEGAEASFVNGDQASLLLRKEYKGTDEIGRCAVDDLYERCLRVQAGEEQDTSSLGETMIYSMDKVEFILTIDDGKGASYVWPETPVTISCINENGTIGEEKFEPGDSITVEPWKTYLIPIGDGTDGISIPETATYTLAETEESRNRIGKYNYAYGDWLTRGDYWMQISQSAASDVLGDSKSVSARPAATICNEISTISPDSEYENCIIRKGMTLNSREVSEGKKLVWRVEQYDAASGEWFPAEKVSYMVMCAGKPVSQQLKYTEEDGRITLFKEEGGYPEVWFTEEDVYLNVYDENAIQYLLMNNNFPEKLFRMVELTEESDKEWGMLAGYTSSYYYDGEVYFDSYSLGGLPGGNTFVNSNREASLEVEKCVSGDSDPLFTMIVEQVVSAAPFDRIDRNNYNEGIMGTRPGAGIPYTVYNADGSVAGSGVTGSDGEIKLLANQYASLEVPEETMWTVSEKTTASPSYSLTDMRSKSEEPMTSSDPRVKILNNTPENNLMLINIWANAYKTEYTIEWRLSYDDTLLDSETRIGTVGGPVSAYSDTNKFTSEPYEYELNESDPRSKLWIRQLVEGGDNTLRVYYDQAVKYTVEVYDPNGKVHIDFADLEGYAGQTVSVKDGESCENWDMWEVIQTIQRDNDFVLDESDPRNDQSITLTPEGENVLKLYLKKLVYYTVIYKDGANGTAYSDESHGNLKEGDGTPAFAGSTKRTGYIFQGWSLNGTLIEGGKVKPTVEAGDANTDDQIIYTATWKEAVNYRIDREYWIGGVKIVTVRGENEPEPTTGTIIYIENPIGKNEGWKTRKVEGETRTFEASKKADVKVKKDVDGDDSDGFIKEREQTDVDSVTLSYNPENSKEQTVIILKYYIN